MTRALLNGNNDRQGFGLWLSDGTAAGTHEITGVVGAYANNFRPFDLTRFGNVVAFSGAASDSFGLWVSDGTAAGTIELLDGIFPSLLTVFGGKLLFAGGVTFGHSSVWITDGTSA